MTLLFLVCITTSAAFSLLFANSIIAFGMAAFLMVFCMATLVGLLLASWAGMILLLVYMGGLMVMFAYFLAICPNQTIPLSKMIKSFSGMLIATFTTSLIMPSIMPNWSSTAMPMTSLYNSFNFPLLILLALILFLTLIAVVKIVQLKQGPLRPFTVKSNQTT